MSKIKVFIDGSEGTTGLRIFDRLSARDDVELIGIDPELRKDPKERAKCINASDLTFLCLPDVASRESVSLVDNEKTIIIDTSTAHRTDDNWAYGFPELSIEFENRIKSSKRIAVPGCHASGVIALVYPLIKAGVIGKDYPLTAYSLTGYSGGGKKMIAEYEAENRSLYLNSPRAYGLTQAHKHLPEIKKVCGLTAEPVFCPIVADYYSGMETTVSLSGNLIDKLTKEKIYEVYKKRYEGKAFVKIASLDGVDEGFDKFIPSNALSGRDDMLITVNGNDERVTVSAVFDNLGKGASGAAIECMNIACGLEKTKGLVIGTEE